MLRLVCLVVEYPDVAVKVVVEEGVEEEEVAGVCREREKKRVEGCEQGHVGNVKIEKKKEKERKKDKERGRVRGDAK